MSLIPLIVSAGGWAGCAVSIYFNVRQHYRLKRQEEGLKRQEQDVRQEKVERGESGRRRTRFRSEGEQHSVVNPNSIPV